MGVKVKFGTVQKIRKNDISPGKIIYIHHHWVTHHHGVLHHHWVEATTHLGHSTAHHHATSATHASSTPHHGFSDIFGQELTQMLGGFEESSEDIN